MVFLVFICFFNCFKIGSVDLNKFMFGFNCWLIFFSSRIDIMVLIKFFFIFMWCWWMVLSILVRILLILILVRENVFDLMLRMMCCILSVKVFLLIVKLGVWYCLIMSLLVLYLLNLVIVWKRLRKFVWFLLFKEVIKLVLIKINCGL